MYYEVYLDLFFLLNVCMNLVSCRLLTVLLHRNGKIFKIFLISAVSALMQCFALLLPWGTVRLRLGISQVVLVPMLVYALLGDKGWQFLKNLASYYLVLFLLGGVLTFLRPELTFGNILVLGFASAGALEILYRFAFSSKRRYLYDVLVRNAGESYTIRALYDSGNHLFEPIGKEQVHIITEHTAASIHLKEHAKGIRVIPFHTIGNEQGIITGYYADEMEVIRENGNVRVLHPLIGISEKEISVKEEYEMILNAGIFE